MDNGALRSTGLAFLRPKRAKNTSRQTNYNHCTPVFAILNNEFLRIFPFRTIHAKSLRLSGESGVAADAWQCTKTHHLTLRHNPLGEPEFPAARQTL